MATAQTNEQKLAQIAKELEDLHKNVVLPMRKKRTELRAQKAALKKLIHQEKASAPKPKKAEKEAKVKTLSQPTGSEKKWADKRNAEVAKTNVVVATINAVPKPSSVKALLR